MAPDRGQCPRCLRPVNHPNRKVPPVDLATPLRADMARTGEAREAYATRRRISKRSLDRLLDQPVSGPIAQMLAEEITERLAR